ncbi:MAG: hypothetical protein EAZ85_14715 [Bacteroidetes bacterium]|nr:MAG: hypothetical protein EAZ85_14715 [Bacteroidota bacterium]TAG85673.1 MAG: hypothetical protein EAZ20_14480 [Bacteroidota bacterium]
MKYFYLFVFGAFFPIFLLAQKQDTVSVGMYITSIHDFNLGENSFKSDYWVWFNYKNESLKPIETMEVVNAKENSYASPSIEKKNGIAWAMHKCKSEIKKQWNIENFPFDKQYLKIVIEEATHDYNKVLYIADKQNSRVDPRVKIEGWKIDSFTLKHSVVRYETTYGDPVLQGYSEYPRIMATITLSRKGLGLFYKLFLGVYIAFSISMLVFFIEPTDVDPRFGLSVGSLFAAVGNKYIVDSILPETVTFTLVDKVHLMTFFFIFLSLLISVRSLYLHKKGKKTISKKLDTYAFLCISFLYILVNSYLLWQAGFFDFNNF